MRFFSVSLLVAASQAIKMQTASQTQALQSTFNDRIHTLIQTRSSELEVPEWASGEWASQYYELLATQATDISETVMNRLEAENPLPEMCERAEECVAEIDELLWVTVRESWENILTAFLDVIDTTETTTTELIETKWTEMHQCSVTYPCCTYSEEYQWNVKEMMRTAKSSMWDQFSDWWVREDERLLTHEDCPMDTP